MILDTCSGSPWRRVFRQPSEPDFFPLQSAGRYVTRRRDTIDSAASAWRMFEWIQVSGDVYRDNWGIVMAAEIVRGAACYVSRGRSIFYDWNFAVLHCDGSTRVLCLFKLCWELASNFGEECAFNLCWSSWYKMFCKHVGWKIVFSGIIAACLLFEIWKLKTSFPHNHSRRGGFVSRS